jgi:teichuronic acid biosynthesis glycosyltransferase TuaH
VADDAEFPYGPSRLFLQPWRWRRHDSLRMSSAMHAYARLDRWLRARAFEDKNPVLITCHPVLAAVADRSAWADVVYYGWDDWLSYPPFGRAKSLLSSSYSQMAAHDVNVIGVTQAILDRIGARRSTVVPNGITSADYDELDPAPKWFTDLPRPVALYAGALEDRVDVGALEECAKDLPSWTFVLVGPLIRPELFAGLAERPNVSMPGQQPRSVALALMSEADVCLIPHRRTPMSVAMSPLKLYEYLGAGAPVVAADLPPMRHISKRCLLVEPGTRLAPAVLAAAALPKVSPAELAVFRRVNDWSQRYQLWRAAALGG